MVNRVDLLVSGTLVNVLTGKLEEKKIAVDDGEVIGFGDRPARQKLEAAYITPGLINSHTHIETSFLSIPHYGKTVIPYGVTSVIEDPHEIGNVLGEEGVRALLTDAGRTPLKIQFTVPSSVPASNLQDAGATLGPEAVERLVTADKMVGLAEVMDIKGVVSNDASIHAKIQAARERGLTIDGHLPRVTGKNLQTAARYLDNDHESISLLEAREKVEAGLKLHLREGSSSKNLEALRPLLDEIDSRRVMICTDNFYIGDLIENGGIGQIVKCLINDGVDPVEAVQMATLNPAEEYDLPFGRIAPGAPADMVLLSDLAEWNVNNVIIDGEIDPTETTGAVASSTVASNTVHLDALEPSDLAHSAPNQGRHQVRVIDHTGRGAEKATMTVPSENGRLIANVEMDVLPVAVVNRHGRDGGGTGFVTGVGLNRGALASTVAHDAHNLVVAGVTHTAMERAANALRDCGGGFAVYDTAEKETTTLSLPIGGLMADRPASTVAEEFNKIERAAKKIGVDHVKGAMALDTLSLEVIPELRLTNCGLVDVERMDYVDVVVG